MAADHFLPRLLDHIIQGKKPLLLGDLALEYHLEKHIPQFLREVVRIAGVTKKIHGSHSLRHLMDHAGF